MSDNYKTFTAFVTHNVLHQFMPFGLINAPSMFTILMCKLLDSRKQLETYVDDGLARSASWQNHLCTLRAF